MNEWNKIRPRKNIFFTILSTLSSSWCSCCCCRSVVVSVLLLYEIIWFAQVKFNHFFFYDDTLSIIDGWLIFHLWLFVNCALGFPFNGTKHFPNCPWLAKNLKRTLFSREHKIFVCVRSKGIMIFLQCNCWDDDCVWVRVYIYILLPLCCFYEWNDKFCVILLFREHTCRFESAGVHIALVLWVGVPLCISQKQMYSHNLHPTILIQQHKKNCILFLEKCFELFRECIYSTNSYITL